MKINVRYGTSLSLGEGRTADLIIDLGSWDVSDAQALQSANYFADSAAVWEMLLQPAGQVYVLEVRLSDLERVIQTV